ncbi:VOC family protein, partial [Aspergillus stella-maris]|uniref:VOC family protein n=1 Tax=Aspergillus stella-maris TaxID=1810926 RepID=UPI003CCDA1B1
MIPRFSYLLSALFLSLHILPMASAQCETPTLPPGMTLGTCGPADPATSGFWINHVGLNVRDLEASMKFYRDVLGMRHIFTIDYTERFSLTYMGFAQGGKNGTGFQTASELLRDKNNSGGLVKLLHFAESEADPVVPSRKTTTLANLGLVVPNLEEAQKRFEENDVTIVKPRGVASLTGDSEVAISFGVGVEATTNATEVEAIVKGLETTGFEDLIFIQDPDGNVLEVVERDGF